MKFQNALNYKLKTFVEFYYLPKKVHKHKKTHCNTNWFLATL